MGTLVNVVAIIVAGLIGLLFRSLLNEERSNLIMQMIGIAIIFISLCGALKSALVIDIETMSLNDQGGLLVLCSLVIGTLLGDYFDLDGRLKGLGEFIEHKFHLQGFALGFMNASLIFCIGAMSIIGSISDGVLHDPSILYLKSAIDFITAIMLTFTLGFGVIFSSISVGVYQGALTLLASNISSLISPTLINNICMIGYLIVSVIGMNFLKLTKIKIANMLPALLIPIILEIFLAII